MKTFAIIVGVDELNELHYGSKKPSMEVSRNAQLLMSYLREFSHIKLYDDSVLMGANAIWNDFKMRIDHFAELTGESNEEHLLIIYMSGHGHNEEQENGELKTFFCFYDQMIIEHELRNELRKLGSNVRVLIIIDSCFAEGFVELEEKEKEEQWINSDGRYYSQLKKYYNMKWNIADSLEEFKSSILFFGACSELERSYEKGRFGMTQFTSEIINQLDELRRGEEKINYHEFFERIADADFVNRPIIADLGTDQAFFTTAQPLFINT